MLAKLKGLRGTWLDVFGHTGERRTERALIVEYRDRIERAMSTLKPDNHATAVAIAEVPEEIRGFGHVKEGSVAKARARWAELETRLSETETFAAAAE